MKNVSICLISTGKYDVFIPQLIESLDKYFLSNHNIEIHLFWDKIDFQYSITNNSRFKIHYYFIPSYRFPEATLLRYKEMLKGNFSKSDYIYYMDVDMRIVKEIGEEIFAPLVAVAHPGYSIVGGGAWCDDMNSLAYTLPTKRRKYIAGGFQGGQSNKFIDAMRQMNRNIELDANRGVMATWHDESHWNKLYSEHPLEFLVLNSGYCMVENQFQKKLWKLEGLTTYIIALDKDHKAIRS